MAKEAAATVRRNARKSGVLGALFKGLLASVAVTVLGVTAFALLIKWFSPGDTVISVMNQALKLAAVLVGARAAVRGGGAGTVLRGAAVGLAYMAVGVIGYAFLSGLALSPAAYLADLGMGVAAGGLFGMVLPKKG